MQTLYPIRYDLQDQLCARKPLEPAGEKLVEHAHGVNNERPGPSPDPQPLCTNKSVKTPSAGTQKYCAFFAPLTEALCGLTVLRNMLHLVHDQDLQTQGAETVL